MTDELTRQACIVEVPGAAVSERWSAMWWCPVCRRGASTFHSTFEAASAFLELMLRDPRCGACRRNQEVTV